MITFDVNFTWDGTSSIVVNTCTGSNSYISPYGGLRYTSATYGAMRYYRTDGSSNCATTTTSNSSSRPNIRFDYTEGTACSGTPAPGNTLSSKSLVMSGENFILSLQNATEGSGVGYQWQSSPTGTDPWTDFGTSNSTQLTSQTADTYYRCQVTCAGNTGTSASVFVEVCPGVTTYPFVESFDGETFPPTCWLNMKTAGTSTGLWERVTAGTYPTCTPHSGAGMAKFYCWNYYSGTKGILVTRALDLPNDDYLVDFWFYRDGGYPSNADLVNVYYNTAPELAGATLLGTVNRSFDLDPVVASEGWYEYVFNFPSGSGGNDRYVIFEGVSAYGNNLFLDDVKISGPSGLSGYVYDYDNNPIVGATVTRTGGLSTTSGADGSYTLSPLSSGLQEFTCTKTGYNGVTQMIDIPEETIVMNNFTLLEPQMAIAPESHLSILTSTETAAFDIDITNGGNGPLDWNAGIIADVSCEYTIALEDSYGDGWNGSELDVLVNGAVVLDGITLLYGDGNGPVDFTFTVSANGDITTVFTEDSWGYECSYTVYDGDMNQVWYSEGSSPDNPPDIVSGELYGCPLTWLSLDMNSGQVDPFGGQTTVIATLNAAETPPSRAPGTSYEADIVFSSPSGIPQVTIPVALVVTDGGLKGPQDLALFTVDEENGKFMLKWKYFTIRSMEFDHFVILRNGEMHGTSVVSAFHELITEPGIYCYEVYAVYEGGVFSDPSNEVCLNYPIPPGVPIANWALILGALLIGSYTFFMFKRRS